MKGKKLIVTLIGLLIVGFGSVLLYKQQQEARVLEFQGYEIETIESKVNNLFNEEKTDIKEDITDEIESLELIIIELQNENLSYQTEKRVKELTDEVHTAKGMNKLQEKILFLFKEDAVTENISINDIENLESSLANFEDKPKYFKRNADNLKEAVAQVEMINEATMLVASLAENDVLDPELSEDKIEDISKIVNKIKNSEIKDRLLKQIEVIYMAYEESNVEVVDEELDEIEDEDTLEVEDDQTTNVEIVQESTQVEESSRTPSSRDENQRTNSDSRGELNNANRPPQGNTQIKKPEPPIQKEVEKSYVSQQYQETKEEVIPFNTIVNENSNLEAGKEIVYPAGTPGKKIVTYEVIIYNNGTSNRKVVSEEIIEPINRVVSVGTKQAVEVEESPVEEGL